MIVFLGVVVGGMVVAMYLPIFDMVNAVSKLGRWSYDAYWVLGESSPRTQSLMRSCQVPGNGRFKDS